MLTACNNKPHFKTKYVSKSTNISDKFDCILMSNDQLLFLYWFIIFKYNIII